MGSVTSVVAHGSLVAAGYSTGEVRILDGEGDTVHKFLTKEGEPDTRFLYL